MTDEYSKVTFIELSSSEKNIFIGTSSGRLYIFEFSKSNSNLININNKNSNNILLNLTKIINDHKAKINYIYFSGKLNIFATVSEDKNCNLYTYPNFINYNVIKNSRFSYDYVFISSNPIPSVCLYSKSELTFVSYTINGTLIQSERDGVKNLYSPVLSSDNSQNDFLVKKNKLNF